MSVRIAQFSNLATSCKSFESAAGIPILQMEKKDNAVGADPLFILI